MLLGQSCFTFQKYVVLKQDTKMCSSTTNSWCKYQADKINGNNSYKKTLVYKLLLKRKYIPSSWI